MQDIWKLPLHLPLSEEQHKIWKNTGSNKMFTSHRLEGSPASLQLTPHLTSLSAPSYIPFLSEEDMTPIRIRKNFKIKDQITAHHLLLGLEL